MNRRRRRLMLATMLALTIIIAGCGSGVGEIAGKVVDGAGKAIGNAKVTIANGELSADTTTTSDGTFTFKDIPHGVHSLSVEIDGAVANQSSVDVQDKSTVVEIVVAKAKVAGMILDHDGNAIGPSSVAIHDATSSTSAGSFVLTDVYYGTQLLSVIQDGVVLHTETVNIDRPEVTVAVTLPSCLPGPDAPAGMTLVYCEDFSEGSAPGDFGFSRESGWTIAEVDGKRWMRSPATGVTSTSIDVPEMGGANKVVVEYKIVFEDGADIYGVQFLSNEFPGGDHRRGGTGFFAASTSKGKTVNTRKITNNNYPGITAGFDHHFLPTSFDVPDGSVVTLRFTYDHEGRSLNLTYNGQQAPGYPWSLPNDGLIRGSSNRKINLFASNTMARWTDIKVWVGD